MERLKALREYALEYHFSLDEFFYRYHKHYAANQNAPEDVRYGEAFYHAFSTLPPSISEGELVVGKFARCFTPAEETEWQNTYIHMATDATAKAGGGQDSHMSIDYELVLSLGLNGIIAKIDNYLLSCDEDKKSFYLLCRRCLEAVISHSESYAKEALRLAEAERNPSRQTELKQLAEICRKVPANPAESFYEAVQSVHFVTYCLSFNPCRFGCHQYQLGHPDRYLLPYYEKDIESGTITKEYAQLLLDCLGIQINNRVPSGLSSGYMVGGRDENGMLIQNELTEMCMQVVDDIKLVYPSVGLCFAEGMEDKYLEKACEIISHGCSHPAIFNDDIITKGLLSYGVTEKEARNYIHSTCVEITPVAASNVWVASPYTNMAQLLLNILDREYADFDGLLKALFEALDQSIRANFDVHLQLRKHRCEHSLNPLLSCFVNDCLERGLDIEQGGARYNWIMPSFVGMANLVDSLYAIKQLVFESREITVKEFKTILDSNFENREAFRQRILNTIPKYGNDIDEVDIYYGIITEHFIEECKKYVGIFSNASLVPSVFCWVMHERFGRETGATPDGRTAGFPLGDGSGPCQGREFKGPTASILSSTKWKHRELIGGVAVNMKFSKSALGRSSLDTMKSLVKTYLKRGGFEMQINVTDKKTLKKAVENPEEYNDLVVRIGGYSDYFVRLSPEMQQEVILRTEHKI